MSIPFHCTIEDRLLHNQKSWLVTGAAGFIGSNLVEKLLRLNQKVVGLDNFSTGHQRNLLEIKESLSPEQWNNFYFIEGDIRQLEICKAACRNVTYILHQAALGSVPRSIEDPIGTNQNNIDGFLNMLIAARESNVARFVYATSSSVYGDSRDLPKVEHKIGKQLSPYAVTKFVNELYANVFSGVYGLQTIGLRYFNVFGRRQDPFGSYAAVIPRWISSILKNTPITIYGDGETSRDFCYVENAVQANLLAAMTDNQSACNQVFNIAVGQSTSLQNLYKFISETVVSKIEQCVVKAPVYQEFRVGDVRHSCADISKAKELLGYAPTHTVSRGIDEAVEWYIKLHQS